MQFHLEGYCLLRPFRDGPKNHIVPNQFLQMERIEVWDAGADQLQFIVPVSFKTDLKSAPRLSWWLVGGKTDSSQRAAVVHDYAYRKGALSKADADDLFYQVMILDGCYRWRAKLMYWSVKRYGHGSYKEKEGQA